MAKNNLKNSKKDFERKRIKPGKLNPGSLNKTDTSFTAKRLLLKDQHITNSNPTLIGSLEPLCNSFTRHYSPKHRREALQHILRLLSKRPSEVKAVLDLLTPVLAKSIGEVEARKETSQLYLFLFRADPDSSWLRAIWPQTLLPHFLLACTNVDRQVQAGCIHLLSLFPSDLLRPVAHQLLLPIAKLLKPNDLEKADHPCVSLLIRLLDLLTEKEAPQVLNEFVWSPILILPSPLLPRKPASEKPKISSTLPAHVIQVVTSSMLLPWTEVAYLFLAQKAPARSDLKESAIYSNSSKLISKLYSFNSNNNDNVNSNGEDSWASFCKLVPLKMFNALHKCKASITLEQ